jgi:hypothetical protein
MSLSLAVLAGLLVACGGSEPVAGLPVDETDPDAVAVWVVSTWFGWQPAKDTNRNDAAARAAVLLAPELQAVTDAPPSPPGGDWVGWASQGAVTGVEVTASPEPLPPSGAGTAYRAYRARVTVAAAGRVLAVEDQYVQVVLTRVPTGWRVAHVRLL